MKRLAAIGLLLLALPGCMTVDPVRSFPPSAYDCAVRREIAGWHMEIVRSVSVDPERESSDRVDWHTDPSAPGVAVSFTMWPGDTGPARHSSLALSYLSRERSDERLRVEIRRRTPGGELEDRPRLAGGEYDRDWRPSRTSPYRRQGTFDWTAVNALVRDGAPLMVVLADEDGRVFRATPFDPAWLTPPLDALTAARPELDAMAADMRNRCTPEPPIVVT